MILLPETSWTGTTHAPGNAATAQVVARAFPGEAVRIFADPSHLAELGRDASLSALPNVSLRPIALSPRHRGSPGTVSGRRMATEFSTLRSALAETPRGEGVLLFLLSTTATTPFAAAAAARLSGRRVGVQVGWHGNLNDAFGWRSRNPLRRALDARSALTAPLPATRFLVLEEAIRDALAALLPAAAERADVLPLPVNAAEAGREAAPVLARPLRFGFVGLGTAAKGMDAFLAIAARLRARHGGAAEFVHVGRPGPGAELPAYAALADPPAEGQLPRSAFVARLASLHHVVLPFRRGYYDLSASGALLDAVTWGIPLIATRVPLTERFFAEHGEVGALCEDEAGVEAAMEAEILSPDPARHAARAAAMRRAAASRSVEALAGRYRDLVLRGFPGLLG